jgi:hypothetical protein
VRSLSPKSRSTNHSSSSRRSRASVAIPSRVAGTSMRVSRKKTERS